MSNKIEVESKYRGYLSVKEENTNIRRVFPHIGFKMSLDEEAIKNISYSPGGREILENYLIIKDEKLVEDLALNLEPEDTFNENDIKELLTKGTYEQLEDALKYGSSGTRELIKDCAIDIKLSDNNKVKLISNFLNINLNTILDFSQDITREDKNDDNRERRSTPFVPSSKSNNAKETSPKASERRRVVKQK